MSKNNPDQIKSRILEHLRKVPIIQIACEKVGLSRATFYRWKKQDSNFAQQVDKAVFAGEQLVNDMAESQLLSAIRDKNLTAIIFWLKHHHKTYATRVELHGSLDHNMPTLTAQQEALINKALAMAQQLTLGEANESEPEKT